MEILKVENLTKVYNNNVKALDNVSFSVDKGEFVAIVGASGSGKSTLLNIIGGLDKPTSGSVKILDKDIYTMDNNSLADFRRDYVGIIYQFYNLIPILDVYENISLPLLLSNKKLHKDKVNKLIDRIGLKDRVNHLPNELSGGEQERVSIGRALINDPVIILADEPTGNLDSKNSDDIVNILKQTNKNLKQTIILVTHNMDIAKQASRIITLSDGKIVGDE